MTTTCASFRDRDTAARWVAGTLPASDHTDFEDHMVSCTDCQADIRLAVAVRTSWRQRRGPRVVALGGLLAAAALLVVFVTGDETIQPKRGMDLMGQAKAALAAGDTAGAVLLLDQVPPDDSLAAWAAALKDSIRTQQSGS